MEAQENFPEVGATLEDDDVKVKASRCEATEPRAAVCC